MKVNKIICAGILSFALASISIAEPTVVESIDVNNETTTQELVKVSRESWISNFNNHLEEEQNLVCTSVIYNDNTVDILIQNIDDGYYINNDNNYNDYKKRYIIFQSIQFNDFLYNDPVYIINTMPEQGYTDISLAVGNNWNAIEKYINNNKNIDLINDAMYTTGLLDDHLKILLRFKPIVPFDEKTEIIVNDHVITINENSKTSYNQNNPGDINNDGLINSKDATLILKYAAYSGTTSEPEEFKVWIEDNQ